MTNGKTLCFKNWLESGFTWVKDLYDENGTFVNSNIVFEQLQSKNNWMCQYLSVKKIVERIGKKFDDKYYARSENVRKNVTLVWKNKTFEIRDKKCKFFYSLLVEKKCTRSYMEKSWCKQFDKNISHEKWELIYIRRVKMLPDNKLSEFLYKLIHNLIVSRSVLFKWKRHDNPLCPICNVIETVKHIYYECDLIKDIWKRISEDLRINLSWEKIVLGFTEDITVHRFRNLVTSIIMYTRFKSWLSCINGNNVTLHSFYKMIIRDLILWSEVVENAKCDKNNMLFKNIWKNNNLVITIQSLLP